MARRFFKGFMGNYTGFDTTEALQMDFIADSIGGPGNGYVKITKLPSAQDAVDAADSMADSGNFEEVPAPADIDPTVTAAVAFLAALDA